MDSTFIFTIFNASVFDIIKKPFSNVTDYVSANLTCNTKGGHLAVIDSSVKQVVIEGLIRQHLANFTLQKASYLFGKKKIGIEMKGNVLLFNKSIFLKLNKINCFRFKTRKWSLEIFKWQTTWKLYELVNKVT